MAISDKVRPERERRILMDQPSLDAVGVFSMSCQLEGSRLQEREAIDCTGGTQGHGQGRQRELAHWRLDTFCHRASSAKGLWNTGEVLASVRDSIAATWLSATTAPTPGTIPIAPGSRCRRPTCGAGSRQACARVRPSRA